MGEKIEAAEEPIPIFVTMVGAVAFATPTPKPELTPGQMKHLERAWLASHDGRDAAAELHVRRLEKRLWPKGFDPHLELRRRAIAADPEAARRENRKQHHWRAVAERKRAEKLNAPLTAPQLDTLVTKLLKDLAVEMERARVARTEANHHREAKRHKEHREAVGRERQALDNARHLRRRIEDERTAQLNRRWVSDANGETDALATERGQPLADDTRDVPDWVRDDNGALARGDDGLPVLRSERAKVRRNFDAVLSLGRPAEKGKKPHLNEDQLGAAIALRDAYSARSDSLGAVDPTAQVSGQRNHENFVAGRFAAAKAGTFVHRVEMALLTGFCLDDRGSWELTSAAAFREPSAPNRYQALSLVRAVCSEGKSLASQGKGRAFERNLTALKVALNVAAEVLRGRPKLRVAA